MRKTKKALLALALAGVMSFSVACGNDSTKPTNPTPPGPGPVVDEEKTYTVTFTDRGTVVATYTDKKAGEKVAVPTAPTREDPRYTFTGWTGLGADATEVTVYEDNATYDAQWNEMFGSDTLFTAKERNFDKAVTIDGNGDDAAWADATAYDLDENGSTVKFLWDADAIYIYADIVQTDGETADVDTHDEGEEDEVPVGYLNVIVDLLHSDKLASYGWDGLSWGGPYRGEPGPMVEGGYTIKAGATADADVAKSGEWLSAGDTDREVGSIIGEEGYTVEFKIGTTNSNIGDYKPHAGQEIGLSIKSTDGASALESFDGYANHGPKSLSNVALVKNEDNLEFLWNVKEVRENYDIVVDGKEDRYLYARDAGEFAVGEDGTTVKALWNKDGNIYMLVNFGEGTTSLKAEAFGGSVEFTKEDEQTLYEAALTVEREFAIGNWSEFTLTVNDDEPIESYIRLVRNENNIGRKLVTAKKLAEGAEIEIDGELDEAYGEKVADINTVTQGTAQSTGEAYIRWDDDYLYVFVDVTDSDVSESQIGDSYNNDSVEVWLDTCQMLAGATHEDGSRWGWGDNNRPAGLYRGEGGFRVIAGKVGDDSGSHWLWDDTRTRPTTASKVTDYGYTVEYKIPWGEKLDGKDGWDDGFDNWVPATDEHVTIYDEEGNLIPTAHTNKVGQIVNIMININDDNGQDGVREGITSLAAQGHMAYDLPYTLSNLLLVADDAE